MRTIEASSNTTQSGNPIGWLWRNAKAFLVVSALLGLVSLNALTLLNDAVHAAGYNVLRAILASALTEAALSRMLRDSPTVKKKRDIARATKVLSEQNARLSASNGALSKRNANLSASNNAIEKKRIELERQNKKIAAEHANLKRVSDRQARTAKDISKRLAVRSAASASRNLSAVAGQAIPVAGTAIIVGMTIWDVRDACATMGDVNELNSAFGHEKEDQTRVCGKRVPSPEQVGAQVKANWKAAYQSAADAVNKAGDAIVPATPPGLSLPDIRRTVCPVVGALPGVCS